MIRKKLALVTVAVLIASLTTGLTANASAADLNGAGSTLIAPLMAQWAQDFQNRFGKSVNYGAVGSGAGISQISARSVDFGASDAPLKPSQAQACNNCVQIPWALTGITAAYHLDGVPKLRLTGQILAGMYLGVIKSWNDPKIKAANPGVALPSTPVTPAFRSDGSGDTYGFTNYLWKVNKTWRSQVGIYATSVKFPTGVGGKGNDGVAAVISSTNGAIGYISASYAIAHGIKVAAVQNAAGKYVYPNLTNIKVAGSTIKSVPANNEMHIVDPSRKYPKAYPISTYTYVIVPKSSPKKDLLSQFILYAVTAGQQFGAALDFAPVPEKVHQAAVSTTKQFQQG